MCPTEQSTTGETPRARTRAKVVISCSTFSNVDHCYTNSDHLHVAILFLQTTLSGTVTSVIEKHDIVQRHIISDEARHILSIVGNLSRPQSVGNL